MTAAEQDAKRLQAEATAKYRRPFVIGDEVIINGDPNVVGEVVGFRWTGSVVVRLSMTGLTFPYSPEDLTIRHRAN